MSSGQGLPTADGMASVYCRQVGDHVHNETGPDSVNYHEWVSLGELIKCDPAGRRWGGRGMWHWWVRMQCNGHRCSAELRVCLEGPNGVSNFLVPEQ